MNTDGTAIFNVVAGSQTQLGSTLPGTVFEGDYTIVLNGASVSMTCPNGVISGTTTLTTGTIMGMNLFSGATPPYTLTAFSVKSA